MRKLLPKVPIPPETRCKDSAHAYRQHEAHGQHRLRMKKTHRGRPEVRR